MSLLAQIKAGTTSKRYQIFIRSSVTGEGLTGLVYNTASLTAYYWRDGATSATAITLATATLGTWASSGFKEMDATNMPGWYEIGIPDACLAAGASEVNIMFKGAANMLSSILKFQLTANVAGELADGAITAAKIATDAIANTKIANGAITASKLATDAITAAKLASDVTTELQSGLATASSITSLDGKIDVIDDYIDTEMAAVLAAVDTEVGAIKAKTDNLPSDPADASDIASSFSTVNSTLSTIAGYIDTEVAAIKAKTDNLPASPAAVSDIPTATAISDAVLKRGVDNVEATADIKSLAQLLGFVMNKKSFNVDYDLLTVYKTDGTTSWFTQVTTPDTDAIPIKGTNEVS